MSCTYCTNLLYSSFCSLLSREDIEALESELATHSTKALASWVYDQVNMNPSSHRVFFRERLNPRTVETYQYGIPGPKACETNARFRRFAFTYKDVELSRGSNTYWAGNSLVPYTPLVIETISISGVHHFALKFGNDIRTISSTPLQYQDGGLTVTLPDGSYTICNAEEVVGTQIGDNTYSYQFQLLVGDICTSSYTNRGGINDGKGDGSLDSEGLNIRGADFSRCEAKCTSFAKVKNIIGGNPEVSFPASYDLAQVSWLDLSALEATELVNLNGDQFHDSNWLLKRDMACTDENGDNLPDSAGLAYNDYSSAGRGKYNLGKSIFAKLPGGKWALHDLRTMFVGNDIASPSMDGNGNAMKRASRDGKLVARCVNAERNIFNEASCKISYDEDACVSVPLPDPNDAYRVNSVDPGANTEPLYKYTPAYAGPHNGGVVVCGSPNEVASVPEEDDHYDVTNRKVQSHRIDYDSQKRGVWTEVTLYSSDQLCQRMAFALSKIFAVSTVTNSDASNSETNINQYDKFVNACFGTYKEVMTQMSFDEEMGAQLTFLDNKAIGTDWFPFGKLACTC
jgi:hypothetical protein